MARQIAIVDLDATLGDQQHREHMIKRPMPDGGWDAYHKEGESDPPTEIIPIVNALAASGYRIIILTGRTESHREATIGWLKKVGATYHSLIMREDGDYRPAPKMKYAMIMRYLTYYEMAHISMVIDDHQGVCELLTESLCVTSLQVRLPKIASAGRM